MSPIGKHLRRKEDFRLVTGRGRFADDLPLPGAAAAVLVRSPYAHARIRSIDTAAAVSMPGVLLVLTTDDLRSAGIGPIPHAIGHSAVGSDRPLKNPDGSERARTDHHPLPADKVRFVGEAYAMVVAETIAAAKDAAEAVVADFEELPAVTRAVDALAPGAPLLWDHVPGNLALDGELGDRAATEAAFAAATRVVRYETWVKRVTGVHMEPRTAAAAPDGDRITVHASSGIGVVHLRDQIADCLGLPRERVRVVAPPDVGGNFGTRNACYPEFVLLAHAARLLGRPVKHVAERQEAFLSDFQGRDLHVAAALALDGDGRFLAFRAVNTSNVGAHALSYVPLNKGAQLMTSLYRIPAAHVSARGVLTNTPPTIPYRSAGRPEAMFVIERLVDLAARDLDLDPAEIRRRNMIPPDGFPYANPFGVAYDSGDHPAAMDLALRLADRDGFEARRREARSRGRHRGFGFANYIEGTSGIPRERAEITVRPETGTVELVIGTQASGQGHETAFAQLAGAFLGLDPDRVAVLGGDTDLVAVGGGSHSGRSLRFGSIVIEAASAAVVGRGREIAAALHGVEVAAVSFADGHFRIADTNRALSLFDVAEAAATDPAVPEALRGRVAGVGDAVTHGLAFPYGTATCEIEIDPETGTSEILRYVSVDDVGKALNPMIVDGQTHGGIVQGAGQALLEWSVFDPDNGQALCGSFMDYAVARASDFPSFTTALSEVPATTHPLGFRPGGEGGTTPALAVVVNAVVDALHDLGVRDVEMPATPFRIWQAIEAARHRDGEVAA